MPVQHGNQSGLTYGQVLKAAFDDTKYQLQVVNASQLVPEVYDRIEHTRPDAVTEVYAYKNGGISGTTVATVTIVYTDASKEQISSIQRT